MSALTSRLVLAVERIAAALDRAIPIPAELTPAEIAELEKLEADADAYAASETMSEMAAMVEMLESADKRVPDAVYQKLGIEPPKRRLSRPPTEEELSAPQPGTVGTLSSPPLEPAQPAELPPPDDEGIMSARKGGL